MTVSTTLSLQLLQPTQGKGRDDFVPAPGNSVSNICLEKMGSSVQGHRRDTRWFAHYSGRGPRPAVLAAHGALTHEVGLSPHPELPSLSSSSSARAAAS